MGHAAHDWEGFGELFVSHDLQHAIDEMYVAGLDNQAILAVLIDGDAPPRRQPLAGYVIGSRLSAAHSLNI